MNYGTIKCVGNGQVDVQLTGSARVLRNVQISAQVSWNTLASGMRVLVDSVNGRPVVLHTVVDVPHVYTTEEQTYALAGAYGPENVLLADGSVPLTGNLFVTPGVKIDGYDISVLGQTIDNLQAADSVARTGYTVMTHASHLVETIGEGDTQIKIRHDLFTDKETLVVSNTAGEIEFMRVVGEATPTVDDHGALCYLYTVTRRTATNPNGLVTGWAAATLVNGLTHRGYIAFDARENRPAAPSMRFVLHTDVGAGTTEHIVRVGSLSNILDYTGEDYGFAVGRLTTADKYLAYSYADNLFRIRGADIAGYDEAGVEVYRIWGTAEGGHVPGDHRFGPASGGHQEFFSESQRLSFFSGSREVLYFSPDGTRFREMLWSGTQPGPQIGIGEDGGEGHIVARSATGVEQFHVRTGADSVHIHMGNPPVEGGYAQFTQGEFLVDGTVRARAFELLGGGTILPGGTLIARDPDSEAYGELAPKYLAGFNESGTQTALIAWGNVTAAGKTWVPGEGFLGPVDASHLRKRGDEMGFFFGDTPKAWLDKNGNASFDGSITATGGSIAGWTIASGHLYAGAGSSRAGLQPASYPFYAGSETPSSAPFRVTPAGALTASNATISGTVYAQGGHFAGSVYVGTADPRIKIDGVNKLIESTNFASGVSGFRLSGDTGDAEFNNVTVRGAINAAVFNYQQVTATAGTLVVTIGAGKALHAVYTDNENGFLVDIEDPDGIAHATAGGLWAVNDIVRIKDPGIADIWAKVTAKADMTTYWRLTVMQQSGGVLSYTFPAGAAVINYGQSGKGLVRITSDDVSAPFLSIATHTGTPWTSQTERVRLGNLAGISGASGYGLWTDNGYFTGIVNASAGSIAGWTIASTKLYWEDAVNYRGIGMATYNDAGGWAFWAGDHRPSYAEFRVSSNGALWATSADITGAITASSGSIGGWAIASGHLYAGSGVSRAGLQPASYPFYAGSDTPSSAPFRVTPAGALTASSATITGTITSTSGTIGGWTIGSTALTSGSGATTVGLDSGGTNPAFYAGSATPASAPFRVTGAGALVASNATITGAITSTSGTIGGWTLASTSLKSGSGSTTVALDSGGTNPAIYAGSATPGSAPFRVTNAGALSATNVSITAGGGNVVVDTNGLTMTYGNTATKKIQWKESGTVRGAIGCWYGLANYAIFLDAPEIDLNGTLVAGKITMTGDLEHSSLGKVGFFGVMPAVRPSAYTFTNGTIDRSVNCDASSVAELADLVYTMWSDLKSLGLLQ